jgi:hypothetical protein
MNKNLRTALSLVLFVLAVVGAYVEVRSARTGLPGPHRLAVTVYLLVAIYALTSVVVRLRRDAGR